jgi:hypothetical protein
MKTTRSEPLRIHEWLRTVWICECRIFLHAMNLHLHFYGELPSFFDFNTTWFWTVTRRFLVELPNLISKMLIFTNEYTMKSKNIYTSADFIPSSPWFPLHPLILSLESSFTKIIQIHTLNPTSSKGEFRFFTCLHFLIWCTNCHIMFSLQNLCN